MISGGNFYRCAGTDDLIFTLRASEDDDCRCSRKLLHHLIDLKRCGFASLGSVFFTRSWSMAKAPGTFSRTTEVIWSSPLALHQEFC
jgi:hypothetical protein